MNQPKKAELARRELERRSNDEVKIHNPTVKDYFIKYGGFNWKVPAGSDLIVPRYIATHYLKHMTDALVLQESDVLVEKAKKKYNGPFWPAEEERIALRTSNPDLRKKYIKQLWLGVVRKFGMDEISDTSTAEPVNNTIPQDEQLLEEMGLEEAQDLSKELTAEEPETPTEEFAKSIAEES